MQDMCKTYNKVTELCFSKCISNMNGFRFTPDETSCVDHCGGKFISSNKVLMATFTEIQFKKQQQMLEEARSQQQAEANKAKMNP
uniref:Mitochondrial import inner membrane translocase subunit n=1 Tax=Helobdella robusta TaxID=6412 RepID=T1G129_HELRO